MSTETRGRWLLFVKRFAGDGQSRWLTDELADSLVQHGADVEIVLVDARSAWAPDFSARLPIRVRRYQPLLRVFPRDSMIAKASALIGANFRAHAYELSRALLRPKYDTVVVFSIASVFGVLPALLRRMGLTRKLVYILWDFFPAHHIQIGVVPSYLEKPLWCLERFLVQSADVICVMSEANRRAALEYFDLDNQQLIITPPWGERETRRPTISSEPSDSPLHLVFGGQVGPGRNLKWLVEQVARSSRQGVSIQLSIVGDVPTSFRDWVSSQGYNDVVQMLSRMERSRYRSFIAGADVGIVVTDGRVGFPTFPSKMVDYFRAGIPVLACLEAASDVSEIIARNGLGIACDASSASDFLAAATELSNLKKDGGLGQLGNNAYDFFQREMVVDAAAQRIIAALEDRSRT